MKIVLYQPWIYLHGGLEKSLLELVTRSRHDWIVYTGYYEPQSTFKSFSNVDVRVLKPTTVKRTIVGTLKSALQVATQKLPIDDDVDAVAIWCDGIGDMATFRNHDLPLINICSTPLRAAFDPVYEELSLKNKPIYYRLAYKVFKSLFIAIDRLAWSYYDAIVTTSTEVKDRILIGQLCRNKKKLMMAYPGIDANKTIKDVEYEPFILVPGRIMWTKNIQQGIEAFIQAGLPQPWKLVIAGFVDDKSKSYLRDLKAMVPEGVNIEFVESPSDEHLHMLYQKSAFCLFTPLNEDWGIVPLEAMSYAKPVIANASGGPLESIEDQYTGFLYESNDIDGWADGIRRLALDQELCRKMGKQAHLHVKKFTWNKFVSRVDDLIEKVVKDHDGTKAKSAVSLKFERQKSRKTI